MSGYDDYLDKYDRMQLSKQVPDPDGYMIVIPPNPDDESVDSVINLLADLLLD